MCLLLCHSYILTSIAPGRRRSANLYMFSAVRTYAALRGGRATEEIYATACHYKEEKGRGSLPGLDTCLFLSTLCHFLCLPALTQICLSGRFDRKEQLPAYNICLPGRERDPPACLFSASLLQEEEEGIPAINLQHSIASTYACIKQPYICLQHICI